MQLKSCVNIASVVFINTPLQTENGNLCQNWGELNVIMINTPLQTQSGFFSHSC